MGRRPGRRLIPRPVGFFFVVALDLFALVGWYVRTRIFRVVRGAKSMEAIMNLARSNQAAALAIVAGGVIGASLSISFLGSGDVPAPDPVVVPAATVERIWMEVPPVPASVVAASAADLVREQHYIEESMKRLADARGGPGSEAGRRLFERKEAMGQEIDDLWREIQRLRDEAQGEEWDRLDDAVRTIEEDDKLWQRVRYSRGLIGMQDREYIREFEAETTRIVEELQEELGGSGYRSGLFVRTSPDEPWIMTEVR